MDLKTGQIAYEIDKSKARFVSISFLQERNEDSDEDGQLTDDSCFKGKMSGHHGKEPAHYLNTYKEAQETLTINLGKGETYEELTIYQAVSDCIGGDIFEVKRYLRDSSDASLFIQGGDKSGDTTLILASTEESSAMVSLLLEHGADVNAINHEGRSALMEASLWGRVDNVELLINGGADKSLRDNKKCRAVDLAQPTRKNEKERHVRAVGRFGISASEPIYRESTFNRNIDRQKIVRLLVDNDIKSKNLYGSPPSASECQDYSFRRSPDELSIVLRGPITKYPVENEFKAIAMLERGGQYPTIAAMSGWGHEEWPSVRVNGKDWTSKVMRVAKEVGYNLSQDSERDRGYPGRFFASHAEKQLIAYFIDRHVFLPQERVPTQEIQAGIRDVDDQLLKIYWSSSTVRHLRKLENEQNRLDCELWNADEGLLGDEYDEGKVKHLENDNENIKSQITCLESHSEVKEARRLEREREALAALSQKSRLYEIAPPVSLTNPVIFISSYKREICEDCSRFKDRVNQSLGLSIELLERTKGMNHGK